MLSTMILYSDAMASPTLHRLAILRHDLAFQSQAGILERVLQLEVVFAQQYAHSYAKDKSLGDIALATPK